MNVLLGALDQTWEPFILILGLILLGHAAASEGLFDALGSRLARLPGGGVMLFVSMMGLVAVVTAALNLDTSVIFLTPILLHTARRRGVDERAFLYGSIFMANSASLLLLGSNLTNILVFTRHGLRGAVFAQTMLPAWLSSVILTTLVVAWWNRKRLRADAAVKDEGSAQYRLGPGFVGLCAAITLMLVLQSPARPILAVDIIVEIIEVGILRRSRIGAPLKAANLPLLATLFCLALGVATLARVWEYPAHVMSSSNSWATAALGVGTANVMNNLPAAALLSAKLPAHPYALLLGLDLGPNVCVIGAMSSLLWLRIARQNGARPSARTFSQVGIVVTLLTVCVGVVLI